MESNNAIKDAFQKAKQDISELRTQIIDLSNQIQDIKSLVHSINTQIISFQQSNSQTDKPTDRQKYPTNQQIIPTNNLNELSSMPLKALKTQYTPTSIGSEGVPTDRQTNQQTDRQTFSLDKSTSEQNSSNQSVRLISQTLDSLDQIKQSLKYQFKSLTKQEFSFFLSVYQLENEGFSVDYPLLSSKLHLSQSSIRDYTLKITRKGLPLVKIKQDNKKIFLSISEDFKKIAPISSLLSLQKV